MKFNFKIQQYQSNAVEFDSYAAICNRYVDTNEIGSRKMIEIEY